MNAERRPGETEAAGDRWAATPTSLRLEISVNLDHRADQNDLRANDHGRADRNALDLLRDVPSGALVRVVVGRRIYWTPDAIGLLREAQGRGVVIVIMAASIESGLTWKRALDQNRSWGSVA